MLIRTRIIFLVLGLALSEAILLGVIGFYSIKASTRANSDLRQISSSLGNTREVSLALTQLLEPIHDYILKQESDGEEKFRQRLEQVEGRLQSCATAACHGIVKQPEQMVEKIKPYVGRMRERARSVFSSHSPRDDPAVLEQARLMNQDARTVIDMTGAMSEALLGRAREQAEESTRMESQALAFVMGATLLIMVVAAILSFPIARSITYPIRKLIEGTYRIMRGDLKYRVLENGDHEVSLLARSFNKMVDELDEHKTQLLKYQHSLEDDIQKRVAEIQRKDEHLRQSEKMASIGLISAKVAHDLNNPLTSLTINANLLQERISKDSGDFKIIQDMVNDAHRCRGIVSELRSFAREKEMAKSSCDILEIIEKALAVMRFEFDARHIMIERTMALEETQCTCVSERLIQLLVNLISNATDATEDGGRIRIGARCAAPWLILEIEDHGPGIPPNVREQLFRQFFTTKERGVGLGLTISKHIAEEHHGKIEYETHTAEEARVLGRSPGTTMRVLLPLSRECAP